MIENEKAITVKTFTGEERFTCDGGILRASVQVTAESYPKNPSVSESRKVVITVGSESITLTSDSEPENLVDDLIEVLQRVKKGLGKGTFK